MFRSGQTEPSYEVCAMLGKKAVDRVIEFLMPHPPSLETFIDGTGKVGIGSPGTTHRQLSPNGVSVHRTIQVQIFVV
jgi:hypothetical protein